MNPLPYEPGSPEWFVSLPQYRKKPIPVTAVQWFKDGDHPKVIAKPGGRGFIQTLEGNHTVYPGCWIVGPGARGEYWPVQDDIFRETYELVPPDPIELTDGQKLVLGISESEYEMNGNLQRRVNLIVAKAKFRGIDLDVLGLADLVAEARSYGK